MTVRSILLIVSAVPIFKDRCYDFKNIFAEKFSEKIGGFDSKLQYPKL
jgi:hypothetical protein